MTLMRRPSQLCNIFEVYKLCVEVWSRNLVSLQIEALVRRPSLMRVQISSPNLESPAHTAQLDSIVFYIMIKTLIDMKRMISILLIVLLLVLPISFAESPSDIKITSFVNDYGDVFSDEEEVALSKLLKNIYDSKTAEFSIVTVKSLGGYDSQGFAQEISEGALGDSEKNNGLLLLIAVEDKKYEFNVGRGLEPIFNDAKIGRIGRTALVPYFKDGMYFEGSISATNEIANELKVELTTNIVPPLRKSQTYFNPMWVFIVIFFIMSIFRSVAAKSQGKGGKRRKNNNDLFLAAMFASSMMRGGGGSSGMGGGFGGGSFGGGGAGGGW